MAHNQFQRGAGVYACRCCQRQTRGSGGDSAGVRLCDQCFDLAGIDNAICDGGNPAEYRQEVQSLIQYLESKHAPNVAHWDSLKKAVA